MVVFFAFIFGTIFGSFLNVLLWRLPAGKPITGRSQCQSCGHVLVWYDLIPIVSFLMLSGRCRHCTARIHVRYPLIELSTGLVLAAFVWHVPIGPLPGAIVPIFGLLILTTLFFFDLFYFLLPNVVVFPAIIIYGIYDAAMGSWFAFLSALLIGGFFAILYGISKGTWVGFGDVKLALLIGLMFGWPLGFLVAVAGIWLGGAVAVLLLAVGLVSRKQALPLGSFLTLAAIVSIIFQHEIIPLVAYFR